MLTALHQNCLDVQMINHKTLGLVLCHMLESNQPRLPRVHQYSRCNIIKAARMDLHQSTRLTSDRFLVSYGTDKNSRAELNE